MRIVLAFVLLFFISSCATYRPLNINNKHINEKTNYIDKDAIKNIPQGSAILYKLQHNKPLTENEIANLALHLNPQLTIERDKIELAKARLESAKVIPNPSVSTDIGFPIAGNIANTYNSYSIGFSYPIEWMFSHSAKVKSAILDYESQKLSYNFNAYQVMQNAKLQAANVYYLEKILQATLDKFKLYTKIYYTIQSAFKNNLVSLSDLEIAKSEYDTAKTQYLNTKNSLENEKNNLNSILGLPYNANIKIDIKPEPNFTLPPLDKLLAHITNRLDIVAYKLAYESQQEKTRAAFISQFPKISISFPFSRDTSNVQTFGFGISIEFPIFNTNKAQIDIQKATQKQMYDEYISRINTAKFDIKKLFEDIKNIQNQLEFLNSDYQRSSNLLDYYNKAYNEGLISILEYYKNVNALLDKKIRILNLEKNIYAMKIALEIASAQKID